MTGGGARISDVEPEASQLRLVTSAGAVILSEAGVEQRRIAFSPRRSWLFPVRRLRDGAADYYAGYDDRAHQIVFFDDAGRQIAAQPCKWCRDLIVAQGDARADVLVVRANDGASATVFSARGTQRRDLDATGYLTDLGAVTMPGDDAATLVFHTSPDPELQTAVRLVRLDGTEVTKWPVKTRGAVCASRSARGTPSVLSIDGDAIVEWDAATGKELARIGMEGAGSFRELVVAWWGPDRRVIVLSGGASLDKHMVAVVGSDGSLLFRRVGERRAWDVVAPSNEARPHFFVAVGGRLERFVVRK